MGCIYSGVALFTTFKKMAIKLIASQIYDEKGCFCKLVILTYNWTVFGYNWSLLTFKWQIRK